MKINHREILLVRKPYKRSIGITLQLNGRIRVSAPKATPLFQIESFIRRHEQWIESNLARYQELRECHPPKRYVAGEEFLFLGTPHRLRIEASSRSSRIEIEAIQEELIACVGHKDVLRSPLENERPELAKPIRDFFAARGKMILADRVRHFSAQMNLRPTSLVFRSQKTRWGSCSSRGRISLNWRLVFAPIEVIDYVVVHELAHLRHYDHSPDFWQLVGEHISGYREKRAWLKANQYAADFLAKESELHI